MDIVVALRRMNLAPCDDAADEIKRLRAQSGEILLDMVEASKEIDRLKTETLYASERIEFLFRGIEELKRENQRLRISRDALLNWQKAAFAAYPNLDSHIDAILWSQEK